MSRTILHRDDNGDVVIQTVVQPHQWCELAASVSKAGLTADARAAMENLHFEDPDDAAKAAALSPEQYRALKRVVEVAQKVLQPRHIALEDEYVWAMTLAARMEGLAKAVDAVGVLP